jgi:hypothetical protein
MQRFNELKDKILGSCAPEDASSPMANDGTDRTLMTAQDIKEEHEVAKKERGLKQLLFHARKKYLERGLEGNIEIYSCITVFTHSISCKVTNESPEAEEHDEFALAEEESLKENVSTSNAHAISAMDGVLKVLELRARGYRNSSFKDDVTLSSGIYVTVPLIGLATISVTFTATVKSLLASVDRHVAQKEVYDH